MKMPEAREKAEEASLATLVDLGRACLRRRRMQAAGGSNSMWEGVAAAVGVVVVGVVAVAVAGVVSEVGAFGASSVVGFDCDSAASCSDVSVLSNDDFFCGAAVVAVVEVIFILGVVDFDGVAVFFY